MKTTVLCVSIFYFLIGLLVPAYSKANSTIDGSNVTGLTPNMVKLARFIRSHNSDVYKMISKEASSLSELCKRAMAPREVHHIANSGLTIEVTNNKKQVAKKHNNKLQIQRNIASLLDRMAAKIRTAESTKPYSMTDEQFDLAKTLFFNRWAQVPEETIQDYLNLIKYLKAQTYSQSYAECIEITKSFGEIKCGL